MNRIATIAILSALLCSPLAFAQTQGAGQDMKNAGSEAKGAAKDTGSATKKTAGKAKSKTKQGVNKTAKKTQQGSEKVQNKTSTP